MKALNTLKLFVYLILIYLIFIQFIQKTNNKNKSRRCSDWKWKC